MGATGFTLIEVLLAVGLLIGGVCVVLFGMHFTTIHSEYLAQMQIARAASQGLLERLSTLSIAVLDDPVRFPLVTRCRLDDLDCDGNPEVDAAWLAAALPGGALMVQIKPSGELRNIHIAACWSHRGRPIGEAGCQDSNGSGWIDSPVMVSTRIGPPE